MKTVPGKLAFEDVQARHPQWRIFPAGNVVIGWYWTARPWDEQKPPVFAYEQLRQGLRAAVHHTDPGELERRIVEQDRLRQDMADRDEHPFSGSTYIEAGR